MFDRKVFIAFAAFGAAVFTAYPASQAPANRSQNVEVVDLNPFTSGAQIPADANVSSIKLKRIKVVQLPTKRIATSNKFPCEPSNRDPDGTAFCPSLTYTSLEAAIEVTYSFDAPAMASDEYGGRNFSFSVYFRPLDLDSALVTAMREGRLKRLDLEPYFQVSAVRNTTPALALDLAGSTLCDGSYWEGNWVQTNPSCNEKLTYKMVAAPSGYIAVKVTPTSPRQSARK